MRPPFLTRFECRIVSYLFQSLTIQCGECDRIQSDCCSTVCLSQLTSQQPAASSLSEAIHTDSTVQCHLICGWVGGWSSGRLWVIGQQTTASCGRYVPDTCHLPVTGNRLSRSKLLLSFLDSRPLLTVTVSAEQPCCDDLEKTDFTWYV